MLWAAASIASAERPAPNLREGGAAYTQYCARCHGDQGKGNGLDAKRLYPRPRDLSLGVYKFRSTASGTPPTDEDLFQTITRGLPGSHMPDWQHLDEKVRWQLVYYLKSLSPVFEQAQPTLVQMAGDPGATQADLHKGRALYERLGCAACHGTQGRANGSSAAGLVDDWGMPIRPANLTQGWSYRGGNDPRSVMLRVLTGIDGAGMPSYAEALSPDDAWQLAYYIASLQEPPHWNVIAHAVSVDGALPTTADDPRWASVSPTTVRLRNAVNATGAWTASPTIQAVSFQVLYNREAVAMRIWWDDPTQEADPNATPDAFAVVLRPSGAEGDMVTLQAWPYAGAPTLDFCVWSAAANQASERIASDYERAMVNQRSAASLSAVSRYAEGRWQVVLQRPLQPASPQAAAAIASDGLTAVAFVVWDGGHADARAVSPWVDLDLRKERHQ